MDEPAAKRRRVAVDTSALLCRTILEDGRVTDDERAIARKALHVLGQIHDDAEGFPSIELEGDPSRGFVKQVETNVHKKMQLDKHGIKREEFTLNPLMEQPASGIPSRLKSMLIDRFGEQYNLHELNIANCMLWSIRLSVRSFFQSSFKVLSYACLLKALVTLLDGVCILNYCPAELLFWLADKLFDIERDHWVLTGNAAKDRDGWIPWLLSDLISYSQFVVECIYREVADGVDATDVEFIILAIMFVIFLWLLLLIVGRCVLAFWLMVHFVLPHLLPMRLCDVAAAALQGWMWWVLAQKLEEEESKTYVYLHCSGGTLG